MIAALDATPLASYGGIQRYTGQLAKALKATFPEDEYHLISDQDPAVRGIDRRWWTIGVQRAMRRIGCHVFHGTNFSVPYLPLRPSVLTLHDLSPWMNPAWHHTAARVRRRTPFLVKLGIATMIITDTEAIRRQAIDHFKISSARIVAVPLAASVHFRPVAALPGPRYFLYVGTVEPRKNVPALLEAWRRVRLRHDVELWLAGRQRDDGPAIAPEAGLRLLGEVPDSQLPGLYSAAVAFVYPTLYEGFGLPVLEAMQCGAAVITSRDPAVMEVSGGAAMHVEPGELAVAMETLLIDPVKRKRYSQRSLGRADDFSWDKTASWTREVYKEAIRRFHA